MTPTSAYLHTLFGDTEGVAHIAVGTGGHFTESGRYEFAEGGWTQHTFEWPNEVGPLSRAILQESAAGADVYVCPYLMHGSKRARGAAVARRIIHADIDHGHLDLEAVRALGGFAVASGTPGNGHVYVTLDRAVTAAEHTQLCRALGDHLGGADAKVADNDVLRPPGTVNGKHQTAVEWAVEPTGVVWAPDELAGALGVSLAVVDAPAGPAGVAEPYDVAQAPQRVRDALANVTDDRSADTMRVVGACHDAGLTLGQTRTVVADRLDLAERLAERGDDDVLTCWLKVTDDRTVRSAEHRRDTEWVMQLAGASGAQSWAPEPGESGVASATPEPESSADAGSNVIRDRLQAGGAFIFDQPDRIPAIWGDGTSVLWAEGEALTICGPSGVGKTTLSGQVVRARMVGGHVLDLSVTPTTSRVLYLAMDRPRQIARSMRRTLGDLDRGLVDERLTVWPGPPLVDVAAHPETLLALAQEAGADTLVVDSIKDAAIGLSSDEVGAGYNRARQICIANGVEVLELHHMVKKGDNGSAPTSLADMYGSAWIGNGSGSVVNLHGEAGDPIVSFRHLKTPADEVGPYKVIHDHDEGRSDIYHQSDLVAVAKAAKGAGITAKQAAGAINGTEEPKPAQVEKARRRLDKLVASGLLERGERGAVSGSPTAVWKHVPDPLSHGQNPGHDSGHARDRGDSGHADHARSRTPTESPDSWGSAGHDSGHAGHARSGHAFPLPLKGEGDATADRWVSFAGGTQEVNTRTNEVRNAQ